MAFSHKGRYLAWASGDNIVRLWDLNDDRMSGTPSFADGPGYHEPGPLAATAGAWPQAHAMASSFSGM